METVKKDYIFFDVLFALAIMALLVFGGFAIGRQTARPTEVRQSDTVIVVKHDTTLISSPLPVYVTQTRTEYLAVTDTIVRNDTAFIPVPIERKVYEDSTYRAVVTGYRASLDSLWIMRTTNYVTVTNTVKEKAPRWSIGMTVGPSVLVTPKGDVKGGIGATAGVSFRF